MSQLQCLPFKKVIFRKKDFEVSKAAIIMFCTAAVCLCTIRLPLPYHLQNCFYMFKYFFIFHSRFSKSLRQSLSLSLHLPKTESHDLHLTFCVMGGKATITYTHDKHERLRHTLVILRRKTDFFWMARRLTYFCLEVLLNACTT